MQILNIFIISVVYYNIKTDLKLKLLDNIIIKLNILKKSQY